jgi:hypothetical protein
LFEKLLVFEWNSGCFGWETWKLGRGGEGRHSSFCTASRKLQDIVYAELLRSVEFNRCYVDKVSVNASVRVSSFCLRQKCQDLMLGAGHSGFQTIEDSS